MGLRTPLEPWGLGRGVGDSLANLRPARSGPVPELGLVRARHPSAPLVRGVFPPEPVFCYRWRMDQGLQFNSRVRLMIDGRPGLGAWWEGLAGKREVTGLQAATGPEAPSLPALVTSGRRLNLKPQGPCL